jgi:predicted dehydrogenase
MADKLRCAVIGAGGGIGIQHLLSLQSCPRAAAVAVSETNLQRAREVCDRFKIPRNYNDYHELLEQPDIEAVIIALPNYLHATVAIDALKAGKHVLLEKPMATSLKEATKVAEAVKKSKCTFMVGLNFRFNRQAQLAKMAVDRGDLGDIYHARTFWLRRAGIPRIGSWFTQKKFAGGGCVYDIGSHCLDLAMHLMRDFEVETVLAQTHAKFGPRGIGDFDWGRSEVDPKKPCDVEDYCSALLKLKNGKTIQLEVGWAGFIPPEGREHGVDLLGTNAGLSLFPARLFRNGPSGFECIHLNAPKVPCCEDRIHHFVGCVLDNKKPLVSLEESLKVQQVLDAIYTSAETGRELRLK